MAARTSSYTSAPSSAPVSARCVKVRRSLTRSSPTAVPASRQRTTSAPPVEPTAYGPNRLERTNQGKGRARRPAFFHSSIRSRISAGRLYTGVRNAGDLARPRVGDIAQRYARLQDEFDGRRVEVTRLTEDEVGRRDQKRRRNHRGDRGAGCQSRGRSCQRGLRRTVGNGGGLAPLNLGDAARVDIDLKNRAVHEGSVVRHDHRYACRERVLHVAIVDRRR